MKINSGFVKHERIVRDVYFNKRRDADNYAHIVIKLGGFILYIGTNYDTNIPYDYRVSVEIERNYKL